MTTVFIIRDITDAWRPSNIGVAATLEAAINHVRQLCIEEVALDVLSDVVEGIDKDVTWHVDVEHIPSCELSGHTFRPHTEVHLSWHDEDPTRIPRLAFRIDEELLIA